MALPLLAACSRSEAGPETDSGTLLLEINPASIEVKASEYGELTELERTVNDYEVFVFNTDGSLSRHLYRQTGGEVGKTYQESLSLPAGEFRIYALLNGSGMGSKVESEDELLGLEIGLAESNSRSGLLQLGSTSASVSMGEGTSVEIRALRIVARLHLDSVRNNLPAAYNDVQVTGFMLINVVGNENLGCSAIHSKWLNRYGRSTVGNRNSIIDGENYKASASALTWKTLSEKIPTGEASSALATNLYCFRNTLTNLPSGWKPEFEDCATVAVLITSINGTTYYYPVRINEYIEGAILPNYSYSMSLTLNNIGSKDPCEMIQLGDLNASISVDSWGDGGNADYKY